MGVGCSSSSEEKADDAKDEGTNKMSGHIYVTNMDRIEKSNLSRQFLFRNSDINEFKSTTAAKAAVSMNQSMAITPYQDKVGPEKLLVTTPNNGIL